MNGKFLGLGAAAVALMGAGGYVYASPYLALNSIKSAVEAKDADSLSSYIDYAALRTDIKSEAKAAMAAEAAANPNNAQAQMGMALGTAMIDQMVDQMVTPEGAKKMLEIDASKASAMAGSKSDAASELRDSFKDMEVDRIGLSEFKLRDAKDPSKAALHFKRDGLSWKLIGIDVPPVAAKAKPAI